MEETVNHHPPLKGLEQVTYTFVTNLNVNSTKEGIKLKRANLDLLSALKDGGEMKKPELIRTTLP